VCVRGLHEVCTRYVRGLDEVLYVGKNEVMVVFSVSLLALTLLYRNAGAFPYGTLGDLTHAITPPWTELRCLWSVHLCYGRVLRSCVWLHCLGCRPSPLDRSRLALACPGMRLESLAMAGLRSTFQGATPARELRTPRNPPSLVVRRVTLAGPLPPMPVVRR